MSIKIPVLQLPDPQTEMTSASSEPQFVYLYQAEDKIYTRRIRGFYQGLRRAIATPLLLGYFLLPWIILDNRPAILLDLSAQKFHIFWLTLWPQDGLLLAWLLMISALGLFAVTAYAGRVWCGFTCPQTVWTQMFIWLEDQCEGDRYQRIKLDANTWTANKVIRKTVKHFLWGLLALATGFTFVGYFYGVRDLVDDFFSVSVGGDTLFWLGLFSLATYLNAGWMREQVCKYMCPYARFQGVMYDDHTKTVSYDATRGDTDIVGPLRVVNGVKQATRMARAAKLDHKAAGLGDCIDCSWCVQVCPVDIDIRDGLQADCINCGLCIDACDSVMDRIGYERGLIRFASELEITQKPAKLGSGGDKDVNEKNAQSINSIKKPNRISDYFPSPRLAGYSLAFLILLVLFAGQLLQRTPLDVAVSRDRGVHFYNEFPDRIENVYRIRIGNMGRNEQMFTVSVSPPFKILGRNKVLLSEGELFALPIRVALDNNFISTKQRPLEFTVQSTADPLVKILKTAKFITPYDN